MFMKKIKVNNLNVDEKLFKFINDEAIPGTKINTNDFWKGFDKAVHELSPINKKLLEKRDKIQKKIDNWHLEKKDKDFNEKEYLNFLKSINYLVEEKEDFKIIYGGN